MADNNQDKADQFAEGLQLLIAEHSRQRYRMNAVGKVLAMMFRELAESTGRSPPLLRGHPIENWIDAAYKVEVETALRKFEDMDPRLAAHLQAAMDRLHVQPDFPTLP